MLNKAQRGPEPKCLRSLPPLNIIFELAFIFIAYLSTAAVRKFEC